MLTFSAPSCSNLDFITDNTDGNINLSASVIKGLTCEFALQPNLRTRPGTDFAARFPSSSPTQTRHPSTDALVLNPIAAGVVFVAFLFGLFSNTACGVLASIMSFFAFLVTIVALALDLGLFVTARHRLNDYSDNINAMLGNAIWLVVAAAILQLIAAVTVCVSLFLRQQCASCFLTFSSDSQFTSSSSKRAARRDAEARPLATGAAPIAGAHNGRRGWFGRNKNTNAYGQNNAAYDNTTTPVMNEKRHFWQRGSKTGAY